jgi:capsular polysaccharide biosynthesis protein
MENLFNNHGILQLLWRRKIHLLVIILLSFLLAAIFSGSFFITPKFKSFAILYPDIEKVYSAENESEQMLQWLESRDIADSIIAMFNLMDHYKISPSDPQKISRTFREFQRNVFVSTTKFESVKIEIMDRNPQMACDMVFAMIDLYNKKVNATHRKKYQEVLVIEEQRLTEKKMQLDSLMAIIIDMRLKYGLIDYGIQTNEVMRGYLGTFDGSGSAQVNRTEINKLKGDIESKGDSLLLLTNLLSSVTHAYNNYLVSYEDAQRNVNKELTFASVVTNPIPADKKSYPIRWIIILISGLSGFLVAATAFVIIDRIEPNNELK